MNIHTIEYDNPGMNIHEWVEQSWKIGLILFAMKNIWNLYLEWKFIKWIILLMNFEVG